MAPVVGPSYKFIARPPTRFSATPANIRSLPPGLGEHTAEVLAELGFSADEIKAM